MEFREKVPENNGSIGNNATISLGDDFPENDKFEEIPTQKRLAPDVLRIKQVICDVYNVPEDYLYKIRRGFFNEPRSVAIYLVRSMRKATCKEIGKQVKISKYTTLL